MDNNISPDYIFETSWEVCNQVGGIYTVLSTRAKTLQDEHKDKIIFIGPDFWQDKKCPFFTESKTLLKPWVKYAREHENINIRVGRWDIPGKPIAILVDFKPFFNKEHLDKIYAQAWASFGVNSIAAFGDYGEAASFGFASGLVIESYYHFHKLKKEDKVIAHFNEWMTAFGLFYIKSQMPDIATIFTTHATSIGRSIAGNNKPLYDYLSAYNGDQMARELNMEAKHSAEKTAAHIVDCFTTVSEITGLECKQLLEKQPDFITPNGFEDNFVPSASTFNDKKKEARDILTTVAETMLGYKLDDDAIFLGTCGRYEYKNKGIDAFIDALQRLSSDSRLEKEYVAFIMVPSHIKGAREDLQEKLRNNDKTGQLPDNFITHELFSPEGDNISSAIKWFRLDNNKESKVKVIFVPSYLNGSDGIFNKSYYELLIGLDITAFPSYYEPWGYTPLESIAFGIPTITTNLSGFGMWVKETKHDHTNSLTDGAVILKRTDYNYHEMVDNLKLTLLEYSRLDKGTITKVHQKSKELSHAALWKNFIVFYKESYTFALKARKNN
ncbi:MAG: glycosyltransferase [Paludibacteraceae bacterium]|nr:glycosyltransferase [Paludibacteraceae bacterium]